MKTKRHIAVKVVYIFILSLYTVLTTQAQEQHQTPVRFSSVFVQPPYPIFLSDYLTPTANKLQLSLLFTDSYESNRDVYIRFRIENDRIRIENKPNYKPLKPITLYPHTPYIVSPTELSEYLDYSNLNISGYDRTKFEQSGGLLPEGQYFLYVQIFDYQSGVALSNERTAFFNVRLFEPPRLILPQNESIIKNAGTQNITFQWQMEITDPAYVINNPVVYDFLLYEITDPNLDPKLAIDNGSVREIHREEVFTTTLMYDVNKPLLEEGKKYAYQIKARDSYDRSVFKNNGVSETGWFYYGYPRNGHIRTEFPENDHGFGLRENSIFQWYPPDNLITGQQYSSVLKIVEVQEGQLPEDAVGFNEVFYSYQSGVSNAAFRQDHLLQQKIEPLKMYAWQVKAYSEETEIAKSEVQVFYGPPLMESFKAGNHIIDVTSTSSTSLTQLTGTGKVKISETEKLDVSFENVSLVKIGNQWFLDEGEVFANISNREPIPLTPEFEKNDVAYFHPDKIRVTNTAMELHGVIHWEIPLLVKSENKAEIKSEPGWLNYDKWYLLGSLPVAAESYHFDLLDPLNFSVDLSESSNFLIRNNNHYKLRFTGKVNLPTSVTDVDNQPMSLKFSSDQLFYYEDINPGFEIRLIKESEVILHPYSYIIDFSEDKSPGKHKDNPVWKGVLFDEYEVDFYENVDHNYQLELREKNIKKTNNALSDTAYSFISTKGLYYKGYYRFEEKDNAYFKTFPSNYREFKLLIDDNKVEEGWVKGNIYIPVISEEETYSYTVPVSDFGFLDGDLDEDLAGTEFVFNSENDEQKINVVIKRAVFADDERLDMTLDLEWPALDISLSSVNNFKIWGNYDIGFGKPNGVASLSEQISGELRGFPILVDNIGCGKNPGLYAFGVSSQIIMGEDVTGPDGPPVSNIYSIAENTLVGKYEPSKNSVRRYIATGTTSVQYGGYSQTGAQSDIFANLPDDYTYDDVEDQFYSQTAVAREKALETIAERFAGNENAPSIEDISNSDLFSVSTDESDEKAETADTDNDNSPEAEVENAFEDLTATEATEETTELYEDTPEDDYFSRENLLALIDQLIELAPPEYYQQAVDTKEFILGLEERWQIDLFEDLKNLDSLIRVILKKEYETLINDALQPIEEKSAEAQQFVANSVGSVTGLINDGIEYGVDTAFAILVDGLIELTEDENAQRLITNAANATKDIIKQDLTGRVNGYADEYIINPINEGVIGKISGIVHDSLKAQFLNAGYTVIDDDFNANLDGVIDLDRILNSLNDEVFESLFNLDTINSRLLAMKDGFFEDYFNPEDIVDDILVQLAAAGMTFLADELQTVTNDLNKEITKGINEVRDELNGTIRSGIGTAVDFIADQVKDAVDNDDANDIIDEIADGVKKTISDEITGRVSEYTNKYVTLPITEGIIGRISGTVQDSIRIQVKHMADMLMNDESNSNFLNAIDVPAIFNGVKDVVVNEVFHPDTIWSRLVDAKDAFFNEYFNPENIFDSLLARALDAAPEIILNAIVESIEEELTEEIADAAGVGTGPGINEQSLNIAIESIPLDFTDFTDKIVGEADSVLPGYDPIAVDFTSELVDVVGHTYMIKHEVYGDVFTGNVDVLVKVPKRFKVQALYMNGTKDDLSYWYAGVNFVTQKDKLGNSGYIPLGIVNIIRLNGYIYHHMSFVEDYPVPDASISYGGDLGMTLVDPATGGADLTLNLDANVLVKESGAVNLEMEGYMMVKNGLAEGTVEILYNSEEDHFYGKGWIEIVNEAFCAEGTFIVDLWPDKWRVAIGTEREQIEIIPFPGCVGIGGKGWIDVNQNTVNMGLGIGFSGKVKESFKFLGTRYTLKVYFGFYAGLSTTIQYNPYFAINEVGVWAEAEAGISVSYKNLLFSGSFDLVSIYLYGRLTLIFNPPPLQASGYLEGRLVLLGIPFEYSDSFKTELN